ncbi:MAG: hypothetical protein ACPGRX_02680 [Bdellovibrionales bacterium]
MDKIETKDDWPNSFSTREELDSMLEAGLKSGVSNRSHEEIFASLEARSDELLKS